FSDNLQSEKYKGFTPHDLIEISMGNDLLFNSSTQQGIMFHMIDALSQFGKLGVLCIGDSPEKAMEYYYKIVHVLDNEKH
ncbi:MAG: peptide ligase PGM1-related protein, partial [Ginsengibacter sp.]